ncbi:MAG: AEC family transporter [Clostridia bacterium]|nr:AEC family transporter [Clostridia bacterium]
MQNFLISFNVVFPIAVMMALGYLMKEIKLVNDVTVKEMNNVVFRIFLPLMVFKNVYESEIAEVFNPRLIIFASSVTVAVILLLFLIVPIFEKDNSKRGVLIQAIFRSNFVIFGIPVTEALCGVGATGTASVLIAVTIPLFNFAAVITLETFRGGKPDFKKVVKGIITNPLIIASLLGLIATGFGISFPSIIEKSMSSISSVTTPLALVMLGASINFNTVGANLSRLIWGLLARLVILPAVALGLGAYVFGFRGVELAILISLFASPSAVSSFTMAQQMGGDDELAGQLVMFGTVASILTVFMWILITVNLGLI